MKKWKNKGWKRGDNSSMQLKESLEKFFKENIEEVKIKKAARLSEGVLVEIEE